MKGIKSTGTTIPKSLTLDFVVIIIIIIIIIWGLGWLGVTAEKLAS